MPKKSTIFIASGGTGGHIIPARCLASELSNQDFKVIFFGDKKYSNYIKENDPFKSKIIASSKIVKSPLALLKMGFLISIGILQSLYFLIIFRPKYLFTFGGYSTFPILIAALITKTKIIIHEQNSHFGKVNRIFAKYAHKIALSFKKTSGIDEKFLSKTVFTGNPVRQEIIELNKFPYELPNLKPTEAKIENVNKMGYDVILASDFYPEESKYKPEFLNILVIGGSGGARIFSEILPKAFFNLNEFTKEHLQITQQCREELIAATFAQYKAFNLNVVIDSFFEDMPELIKASHLVIARSGSSSIFEFCAAKKPMILIPFALAADNHQEKNARYLEENGAAIVLNEAEFTINKINSLLKNILDSETILKKMSQNAAELAVLDATKNLANLAFD